ncbi:MAG: tRNA 2-thiouridine synthesizing protein E [Cellvibrionaceae bacterium]|jgi:tRNA 2-thiouridine synthesizing protein E
MTLDYRGESIATDREGYLKNLDDWSEEIAELIALEENVELSGAHWELINLVRDFYREFELSPAMRPLVKYSAQRLGAKKGNSIYLLTLFPGSPAKLLSKIAGLPRPKNCL